MRRIFLADGRTDFPGNLLDVAEIELAIFQTGRSDANERDFGIEHGLGRVSGRMQPSGTVRLGDHLAHAGFDDRSAARSPSSQPWRGSRRPR